MDSGDLADILGAARRFVRDVVVPAEDEIEETDAIPARLREQAAEMGLFGFAIPQEDGGLGLSMSEEVRLVFELGYASPAFRSMFGTNNGIAGHVLIESGTREQRERFLPRLASGEWTASFGLTEAEAGSDPGGLSTVAVRDGDQWVIDGAKRYITNAPLADSQAELMAGRGLVLEAARAFDAGEDTRMGPACAKYFCSEMVGRVADRAVQVYGGAGYMRGVPVERLYRDARLFRLYEGTSQIQQLVIARDLTCGR
jgi:alkylation response protein AidB-like acyl-CoA dehydrogenase